MSQECQSVCKTVIGPNAVPNSLPITEASTHSGGFPLAPVAGVLAALGTVGTVIGVSGGSSVDSSAPHVPLEESSLSITSLVLIPMVIYAGVMRKRQK